MSLLPHHVQFVLKDTWLRLLVVTFFDHFSTIFVRLTKYIFALVYRLSKKKKKCEKF